MDLIYPVCDNDVNLLQKDSEIRTILSTLPAISIVGFEVSAGAKTDNIDELLILENGVTPLTVWTEIQLTATLNPNPSNANAETKPPPAT